MNLIPGTVFYIVRHGYNEVYQVLEINQDAVLVKSFWPEATIPTLEGVKGLSVRAACTSLNNSISVEKKVLGINTLTESDYHEISSFKKIQAAQLARLKEFEEGIKCAENYIASHKFQNAIELLTIIAPYNKMDLYTYELRGRAYSGLGLWQEARYDFCFILDQDPDRIDMKDLINAIDSK